MTLDSQCRETLQRAPNACVAWCLMASWLYYHRDRSLLSDPFFDWLCFTMAQHWPTIHHPHKHLISLDTLSAGSLYQTGESQYPAIVKDTATMLLKDLDQ